MHYEVDNRVPACLCKMKVWYGTVTSTVVLPDICLASTFRYHGQSEIASHGLVQLVPSFGSKAPCMAVSQASLALSQQVVRQ
jgi:hypothetical protein